jgi:two-component system cell cycle sensor histidine kinase/response regulator CckA
VSQSLRLFLIEDNDAIALLIRKSLERAGHRVTLCRTGTDALTVLGHQEFDLVLLDQVLPDMSGLDLLRDLDRYGILTPVLMVTGAGDEQLATQVLHAGALDYVIKDPDLGFLVELPKRVDESVLRHQLKSRNDLYLKALDSARDGILIAEMPGTILHVNHALEGMTGYSREDLLHMEPAELFAPAARADFRRLLDTTVMARTSGGGDWQLLRKDQGQLDVSLTVSPVVDRQGQLRHFVAILRDVSEHRHLERQLRQAQKMQSVGTLAGGVAHEFNNLLAGINGYASLALREPGLGDTAQEFLGNIVALSERAASLTRQLLTFARKPPLTRRPTSPAELLRSTRDLVTRTLHQEVALDLDERSADGEPLLVSADANQLQQALVNLALNAHDAVRSLGPKNGQGGPSPATPALVFRLRHEVLTAEQPAFPQNVPPGDYVLLEVEDRGCGMTDKVLSQALDPFFTTKEVGQGTGLGLPMVFGIVQGHHGFLSIDSTTGRGTRVGLYLPRLQGQERREPAEPFEPGQILEPEAMPGRSILVIDDEAAVQDVIRRYLEIPGHRVACASSGQEGIDRLKRGEVFDLVVLDLMMPHEDGVTTFQWLRQRCPHLPVLLCTGLPQGDPAPQLLELGAAGIVRKPFKMNELWYAVKRALDPADGPIAE